MPIITEVEGRIQFVEMIEGVTIQRQTDDLTGLSSIVILDAAERTAAGKDMRPAIRLVDASGNEVMIPGTDMPAQYFLPGKSYRSIERWC